MCDIYLFYLFIVGVGVGAGAGVLWLLWWGLYIVLCVYIFCMVVLLLLDALCSP